MPGFLLFIALVASLIFGGQWLIAHPGNVVVHWLGYDITLHIAVVTLLLITLSLLASIVAITVWKIINWPKRRRNRRQLRTLQSGLRQLTLGVTALAMGDEAAADAALKKAVLALPDDPLPQLLTAQLLQRQGKLDDARAQFRVLMQHKVTAPLATRRLIEQHVQAREWIEASKLAEMARKEAPKDRWLVLTLIDLYARDDNSTAMLALSEGWQWQSPLTKDERHRTAALAHYLAARRERDAHKKEQSLRHAVGYAPDFLPAVIDFAAAILAQGQPRRARKWLRGAWEKTPSPLLIAPILATLDGMPARAQLRLLRPFMSAPLTIAHHLLAGEQAFAAREWAAAKTSVEAALTLEENKTACRLMAKIEAALHNEEAANRWLQRAVDAAAGETWVCEHCGEQHPSWHAHCGACQHFDSLRYSRPEARITSVELAAPAA
ncbi:MAG: heme biosynthesis HemY N-terminal domain-containing protein [Alphaproteobacteria bacterium]|nr:heme biosynthesis HemY N-terminal domain-containing protein [Alphaproteobacteria bacterium]